MKKNQESRISVRVTKLSEYDKTKNIRILERQIINAVSDKKTANFYYSDKSDITCKTYFEKNEN